MALRDQHHSQSHRIIPFLRRVLRPTISPLDNNNITSFLSVDDIVFIGHIYPADENVLDRFNALAGKYHDRFSFGLTSVPTPPSAIGCYNNADNIQKASADLTTIESLSSFVKQCSTPLVPELSRRNELAYLKVRPAVSP